MPSSVDMISRTVIPGHIDMLCKIIREQSHDMVCLNDAYWDIDFELLSSRLQEAFHAILPDKSSFEK